MCEKRVPQEQQLGYTSRGNSARSSGWRFKMAGSGYALKLCPILGLERYSGCGYSGYGFAAKHFLARLYVPGMQGKASVASRPRPLEGLASECASEASLGFWSND